jgi:putative phage-type endonuclease
MAGPQFHGFGHAVLVIPASEYRRDKGRWLAARRSGLGATDTAAILGLSSYRTALDVWLDKTATGEPVEVTSDPALAGQMLEAPVARRAVRENPWLGKLVSTPGLLAHPDHPWLMATPDYGLAARKDRNAPVSALLEVKTTQEGVYRKAWANDVPPPHILIQCQQQLAVTGYSTCWVTCMRRDTGRMAPVYQVERSEQVIEQILHYAGTWWEDHIIAGKRPEPVFEDVDKMAGLFPADITAEPLPVTEELEWAVKDLTTARQRIKAAEEDEARARFTIQKALGDKTALADSAGEILLTWKETAPRMSLDQKALAADHPAIYQQYRRPGKASRPLLLKGSGDDS